MQCKPIELCPDRRDHFRMAMAQGKNAKPAETVDEFPAAHVADQASFSAPFHNAVCWFGVRPPVEILIEIVDRLSDELVLLLRCFVVYIVKIHARIVNLLQKISQWLPAVPTPGTTKRPRGAVCAILPRKSLMITQQIFSTLM